MTFIPTTRTSLKAAIDAIYGPSPTLTESSSVPSGEGTGLYGPIDTWNVTNVTNMSNLFAYMTTFNEPINNWNVNQVTNFSSMFSNASSFNQPLGNWKSGPDITNNMDSMFENAVSFNQDINSWRVEQCN